MLIKNGANVNAADNKKRVQAWGGVKQIEDIRRKPCRFFPLD